MISNKIDNSLVGNVKIPGDKSISHRSIIIPSISRGICKISNLLESEDVLCTINAFKEMGVKIEKNSDNVIIYGNGLKSLKKPNKDLYMGNSGTSARLLTGLLSTQDFETTITGDKSLSSRPMKRIANPLIAMNANIRTNNGYLPLTIAGKIPPIPCFSFILAKNHCSHFLIEYCRINLGTNFSAKRPKRSRTKNARFRGVVTLK